MKQLLVIVNFVKVKVSEVSNDLHILVFRSLQLLLGTFKNAVSLSRRNDGIDII